MEPTKTKIMFRNDVQATLFEEEISGQLSDGYWEGTTPHGHWRAWCHAEVGVAEPGGEVGRDFAVKRDRYALTNHDLLDVVGHRMLVHARLCLAYGRERVHLLEQLFDGNGDFRGAPPADYVGSYWDGVRKDLEGVDSAEVKLTMDTADEMDLFTMKDLRHELRDMAAIMKTRWVHA